MPRFDRYMLGRQMALFGFFALVLVSIYWVNRAVALFDQLISDGQSAMVFLELTVLSLPNVVRMVLPMAAFAATVAVGNRLASDSELVVMQATGFSPWRLARPVLVFGLAVALMLSLLTHLLVPASLQGFNRRQAEIAANVSGRFLNEGQFLHPARGVTVYVRELTPAGVLHDIFLSDATQPGRQIWYTAREARILRSEEVSAATAPRLVMVDGMVQTLEAGRLSVIRFSDFSYDLAALIPAPDPGRRRLREMPTPALLVADEATLAEAGATRGQALHEGHARINQAILALVAALTGFAALLVGGFSRFGLWRQILGGVLALILLKSLDNMLAGVVRGDPALWALTYGSSVLGLALSAALLWLAARPALFVRRERAGAGVA